MTDGYIKKRYTFVIRPIDRPLSEDYPIEDNDFSDIWFDTLDESKQKQDSIVKEWLKNHDYKPNQRVIVYHISS